MNLFTSLLGGAMSGAGAAGNAAGAAAGASMLGDLAGDGGAGAAPEVPGGAPASFKPGQPINSMPKQGFNILEFMANPTLNRMGGPLGSVFQEGGKLAALGNTKLEAGASFNPIDSYRKPSDIWKFMF